MDWPDSGGYAGTGKGTIKSFNYAETWKNGLPTKVTVASEVTASAERTGASGGFTGVALGEYRLTFTSSKAVDIRLKMNADASGVAGKAQLSIRYSVRNLGETQRTINGPLSYDQTESFGPGEFRLRVLVRSWTCTDETLCSFGVDGTPGALATATGRINATFTITPKVGCDISGTSGDDVLVGTSASERICGFGGNDVIKGKGGNDVLIGGPGNDRILGGGAGPDILRGSAGKNTLKARDRKRDQLDGGPGFDKGKWDRGKDRGTRVEKRL